MFFNDFVSFLSFISVLSLLKHGRVRNVHSIRYDNNVSVRKQVVKFLFFHYVRQSACVLAAISFERVQTIGTRPRLNWK